MEHNIARKVMRRSNLCYFRWLFLERCGVWCLSFFNQFSAFQSTIVLPTPQRKIILTSDWLKAKWNWVLISNISYWVSKKIHSNYQFVLFKAINTNRKLQFHHRMLPLAKGIILGWKLFEITKKGKFVLFNPNFNNRKTCKWMLILNLNHIN